MNHAVDPALVKTNLTPLTEESFADIDTSQVQGLKEKLTTKQIKLLKEIQ